MQEDRDILFGTAGVSRFAPPREQLVETRPESHLLRMGLIAGGVAVAVLAVLTVWSWVGHHHTGTPVVEADTRPVKERPLDQGGLKVEGANEAILSGKTDSKPNVTAAPEAPALGALRAAPPPLKVIDTPSISTGSTQDGVRVSTLGETPMSQQLNINVHERPAATAETGAPAANQGQKLASAATPAPAASAAPVSPAPAAIAPAAPTPAASSPAAAKPVAKLAAATPSVAHVGSVAGPVVQLAALASEKGADQEWQRVSKRYAAQLGGHEPVVTSIKHDGKTMWRLRVTGFSDLAAARTLCDNLKTAGGQCMVVPKG